MMKQLRTFHLYLGCVFGPLLLFFAVSGIWQTLGLHQDRDGPVTLALLSSIHTTRGLKGGDVTTLSSPLLEAFAIAMAAGLILTAILGIVMAVRFGRSRSAVFLSLAVGALLPAALILNAWRA